MSEDEFSQLLAEQAVTVVHFSHYGNMGRDLIFPDDMNGAILNKDAWALSCCALTPGRRMSLPGEVGLLLRPKLANVLSVSSSDAGASTLPDGSELSGGDAPTRDAVLASLDPGPNPYNEWRVQGAEVVGIFVAHPSVVAIRKRVAFEGPFGTETTLASESVPMNVIFDAFPRLPVFTMGPVGLVELKRP